MSWLWTGLYWLWSLDPVVLSLIPLAWFLGALAVAFVDPVWLSYVDFRRVKGVQRHRAPAPQVVAEPDAQVIDLTKRRNAA